MAGKIGNKNTEEIFLDENLPFKERKEAFDVHLDEIMNPIKENFDPETFDPLDDLPESKLVDRKRIKPTKLLPTFGMNPKQIREGQMIGMYESKQDLYLLFAHRCNDIQVEIDDLKKQFQDFKNLNT